LENILYRIALEGSQMSLSQWLAFLLGLGYVYLAIKNDPRCWIWGVGSSALWAYSSWFELKLYSDSLLQVIYVFFGIWGLWKWRYAKAHKVDKSISRMSINHWFLALIGTLLASLMLGYYMALTAAAYPYLDAALSVGSVVATILLIYRKWENWWWWIVIDLINIPVFISRGGYLFALLFAIYGMMAYRGLRVWKKMMGFHR
jgi:nicotinamide mononucleotide transporter